MKAATPGLCTMCNQHKPLDQFPRKSDSRTGRMTFCRDCWLEKKRKTYHALTPEKKRRLLLSNQLRNRGVTLADYDQMVKDQQGRCALCEREVSDLDIDHCHQTQRVRKLLCRSCNTGLGMFKDNIDLMEKAIAYIKQYR
jgi:hypothetical protein